MEPSQSAYSEVNTEHKPIYKPKNKYNLQEAVGLKNEKQRWLSYLDIMRETLYKKNVDFNSDYRSQKHVITSQIVRAFKKKAPDFPVTAGDWAIKEMLITTVQNKQNNQENEEPLQPLEPRNDISGQENNQENEEPLRPLEPRNDISGQENNQENEEPLRPLEPCNDIDGQDQNNVSKRKFRKQPENSNLKNQDNAQRKKRGRKPKSR
ncbi:unnamed protein product [Rhizophagus irregularis]|nr:unnamed protein product [Rhizophagus irregularis]